MKKNLKLAASALTVAGLSVALVGAPSPVAAATASKAAPASKTAILKSASIPTWATTTTYPTFTSGPPVVASAGCAVSVAPFVDRVTTGSDDTAAFAAAMTSALSSAPSCYAHGPSGASQAVVYVPAGTYQLDDLRWPSNIRMEVDAGAELRLPPTGGSLAASLMNWGDWGRISKVPLTNVSLIGVSQSMSDAKRAAESRGGAAIAPFDLSTDFTMNLDAAVTGSTNYGIGVDMSNVRYFLIQNLFSLQNNTDQPYSTSFARPTSGRPVLALHARTDSPLAGPFLQPTHGNIVNHVDVDAPRGFGPNQVGAAEDVHFRDIYSEGGTTLRMETDGSLGADGKTDRGATVNDLTAQNIVGVNCNRAVSLAPHAQVNGHAAVTDVWAYSCSEAVVARRDGKVKVPGSFDNPSVTGLHVVGGMHAQLDSTTSLWVDGPSAMRVLQSPRLGWAVTIGLASASGTFTTSK